MKVFIGLQPDKQIVLQIYDDADKGIACVTMNRALATKMRDDMDSLIELMPDEAPPKDKRN